MFQLSDIWEIELAGLCEYPFVVPFSHYGLFSCQMFNRADFLLLTYWQHTTLHRECWNLPQQSAGRIHPSQVTSVSQDTHNIQSHTHAPRGENMHTAQTNSRSYLVYLTVDHKRWYHWSLQQHEVYKLHVCTITGTPKYFKRSFQSTIIVFTCGQIPQGPARHSGEPLTFSVRFPVC